MRIVRDVPAGPSGLLVLHLNPWLKSRSLSAGMRQLDADGAVVSVDKVDLTLQGGNVRVIPDTLAFVSFSG